MFAWMGRHKLALIVSCSLFALMAMVMAEFLLAGGDSIWDALFEGSDWSGQAMLWTWRLGGLVTWPVFMLLLLWPQVGAGGERAQGVLVRTAVLAALYGGGGLWALSEFFAVLSQLADEVPGVVAPFLAVATLVLPYLYTWGFVAIYGFARDALSSRTEHGWVLRSLGATVLGVYGIGALIYGALAVTLLSVWFALAWLPDNVALHVSADLCAIALSTGNFASQWFAFSRVDAWYDEQAQAGVSRAGVAPMRVEAQGPVVVARPAEASGPVVATTHAEVSASAQPVGPVVAGAPQPPVGASVQQPAQQVVGSVLADGSVRLEDGRIVTPDGRVYVEVSRVATPDGRGER